MKIKMTLFLLILSLQATFSQRWKRIEIDEKISIRVPRQSTRSVSGDKITVAATSRSGDITVERIALPDSLSHDDSMGDMLKYYAYGYMKGMESIGTIEIIENNSERVDNVSARNVLFRTGKGQLNQFYFIMANRKIYIIKFRQSLAPSDTDRRKVFSSIKIK